MNNSNDISEEAWTSEYTIDELFLHLAGIREQIVDDNEKQDSRPIHFRKYYHQARDLMKWIPISKPPTEFIINISDLSSRIIEELQKSNNATRTYIITQAVGRLFENLDFEYYHLSIARNLRVRFEK